MSTADGRETPIRLGKALFDPESVELTDVDGRSIALREKSLHVLRKLAERNGETVERDDLIAAVWKGRAVSDDNLVQCIKDIRAALGDRERTLLRTSVGRGYRLQGVREIQRGSGAYPVLLVSPFRATGEKAEVAHLAEVITEDLIVALSPRAGFKVTSDEAQRRSAHFEVEGRVSLPGDDFRVFVQLRRGKTGTVSFAETWTIPLGKADSLPGQITDKIATVLRIHMFNHAGEEFVDRDNASLNNQELLAKAAFHMSRIQMRNRDEARAALLVAVERDPDHAMTLAMRASVAVIALLQEGYAKLPDSPEFCLEMADRAEGIAPQVDFVMLTRGCVRLWLKADHEGARADFERALEGNPVFHLAHQFLAVSEILSGEYWQGLERLKRIIKLGTVNNPRYPHYLALLALGEILAGNEKAAVQASQEAHERAPSDPWCAYVYAASLADCEKTAKTDGFRRMLAQTELPFSHFRDLPFTEPGAVEELEGRLIRAGYPRTS
jgi:DNA-binding winged helix-turn-helix (wHTH) protein